MNQIHIQIDQIWLYTCFSIQTHDLSIICYDLLYVFWMKAVEQMYCFVFRKTNLLNLPGNVLGMFGGCLGSVLGGVWRVFGGCLGNILGMFWGLFGEFFGHVLELLLEYYLHVFLSFTMPNDIWPNIFEFNIFKRFS